MDSNLDKLLNKHVASRANKHHRASQKGGRPSKLTKKSDLPPLVSKPSDLGQVTDPTRLTEVVAPPPASQLKQAHLAQPPIQDCHLTITTYMLKFVVDSAAGTSGVQLGSDALTCVSQCLSSLGAPQWDFLTTCQNANTLFDKSGELLSSAFLTFIQHNYILNQEVATSKVHAQEARDAQLRAKDDLKKARLEMEAARREVEAKDAEIKTVQELDATLEATRKEVEARDIDIRRVQGKNAKLEEDKKTTFEFIESENACLLEEFRTKKDHIVDMAMYRIWANKPDLDTSFCPPGKPSLSPDGKLDWMRKWPCSMLKRRWRPSSKPGL
ncbi:uncharacterized protein LOC133816306 [Humulus lupulus]|uniref:uncharacterized protein LOC133816306 n=1 Tax=Humulus lupulus TaxID=3486 RepID=UPI002B40113A|nr:uncharacterized protein LOC133816306 [Humulus lupulus]